MAAIKVFKEKWIRLHEDLGKWEQGDKGDDAGSIPSSDIKLSQSLVNR